MIRSFSASLWALASMVQYWTVCEKAESDYELQKVQYKIMWNAIWHVSEHIVYFSKKGKNWTLNIYSISMSHISDFQIYA